MQPVRRCAYCDRPIRPEDKVGIDKRGTMHIWCYDSTRKLLGKIRRRRG